MSEDESLFKIKDTEISMKSEFTFTIPIDKDNCQRCPIFYPKPATKQIEKVESESVTSITPVCDEHAILNVYDTIFTTIQPYKPWKNSKE